MVVNGGILMAKEPIADMIGQKMSGPGGTSYGLGEAGYDIRIKQEVRFRPGEYVSLKWKEQDGSKHGSCEDGEGNFTLASAIERFQMPDDLMGIVHDKSTWARRRLSVFNTVIEPGWNGFLTLELVYHGKDVLVIPAGSGIAQVVFHLLAEPAEYTGKYQNQEDQPVAARESL